MICVWSQATGRASPSFHFLLHSNRQWILPWTLATARWGIRWYKSIFEKVVEELPLALVCMGVGVDWIEHSHTHWKYWKCIIPFLVVEIWIIPPETITHHNISSNYIATPDVASQRHVLCVVYGWRVRGVTSGEVEEGFAVFLPPLHSQFIVGVL